MSSYSIVNAAPVTILYGIQDVSGRPVPREPEAIPTHLPLTPIFAKKGQAGDAILATGAERQLMFGSDTFSALHPWHNHATELSNLMVAEGNVQMYQRVIPPDAGPAANLTLWADVLEDDVDDYERNTDGSIKLDSLTLDPIVKAGGPIAGHKVRFYVTHDATHQNAQSFGVRTISVGTQTKPGAAQGDPPIASRRIPLMDLKIGYQGSHGNNIGIRLWSPVDGGGGSFDKRILERSRVYPIRLSVVERNPVTGTAKVLETIFGDQAVLSTLKPKTNDPITTGRLSITDTFLQAYQNLTDPRYPAVHGEFGSIHIYDANIKGLLAQFTAAEKEYFDDQDPADQELISSDFVNDGLDEDYLFNFLSGQASTGYPYHTYQIEAVTGSVRLGEFTNLFANGGSDGTMNNTVFADLVGEIMDDYLDPNSDVHNTARRVESIFYDTGYPLETKFKLTNFISVRKDTFLHLATYEADTPMLTATQDNAVAVALRSRVQLFPESEFFGTATVRCLIMGRTGFLRNSLYTGRVSPLFEVGIKSARYMGASDGKWKAGKNFDGSPGSILEYIYNVSDSYTPASVRNRDWDAGLNWVQDFDRRSLFFPALKTVFNDDTSVNTSYFTAMCAVECNKVLERAWRTHSGISGMSDGLFASRVDEFVTRALEGRFDGRFIIESNTYYTNADTARGFSWHTRIDIYAPSMKTVMTGYVRTMRLSDYVASAT